MKMKAFVFDGALVHLEFIHFESWKLLLKEEYNINFDEQNTIAQSKKKTTSLLYWFVRSIFIIFIICDLRCFEEGSS